MLCSLPMLTARDHGTLALLGPLGLVPSVVGATNGPTWGRFEIEAKEPRPNKGCRAHVIEVLSTGAWVTNARIRAGTCFTPEAVGTALAWLRSGGAIEERPLRERDPHTRALYEYRLCKRSSVTPT